MDRRRLATGILLGLLVVFVLGTVVYWVLYFFVGGVQSSSADWYLRFENAFPVADAWAVLACLLATVTLLRSDTLRAPYFLGAAGASVLYLALMDITFDLENSIYSGLGANGAVQIEFGINLFTLVTGLFALGYGASLLRPRGAAA